MAYTLYDATLPLLSHGMNTLLNLISKAESFAKEKGIDVSELTEARLCKDMLPFTFQVYSATDTAQKVVHRVHGTDPEKWANDLKTVEDLKARIAATVAILESADKSKFESRQHEIVTIGLGKGTTADMEALEYAVAYGIPNFFFHLQTAYSILRCKGVPLGKSDYLGSFLGPYIKK